jgi:hypothetical protein
MVFTGNLFIGQLDDVVTNKSLIGAMGKLHGFSNFNRVERRFGFAKYNSLLDACSAEVALNGLKVDGVSITAWISDACWQHAEKRNLVHGPVILGCFSKFCVKKNRPLPVMTQGGNAAPSDNSHFHSNNNNALLNAENNNMRQQAPTSHFNMPRIWNYPGQQQQQQPIYQQQQNNWGRNHRDQQAQQTPTACHHDRVDDYTTETLALNRKRAIDELGSFLQPRSPKKQQQPYDPEMPEFMPALERVEDINVAQNQRPNEEDPIIFSQSQMMTVPSASDIQSLIEAVSSIRNAVTLSGNFDI